MLETRFLAYIFADSMDPASSIVT